eukprot:evm.model.scf_691.2 EVM.evm.TU.scf_691.2   scf_691:12824-16886(+)
MGFGGRWRGMAGRGAAAASLVTIYLVKCTMLACGLNALDTCQTSQEHESVGVHSEGLVKECKIEERIGDGTDILPDDCRGCSGENLGETCAPSETPPCKHPRLDASVGKETTNETNGGSWNMTEVLIWLPKLCGGIMAKYRRVPRLFLLLPLLGSLLVVFFRLFFAVRSQHHALAMHRAQQCHSTERRLQG